MDDTRIMGACAKKRVTCTIRLPGGMEFFGTNDVYRPQAECPRLTGPFDYRRDDYDMCAVVCDQPAHAEMDALAAARKSGMLLRGATAYISHWRCCPACEKALKAEGIEIVLTEDKPANSIGTPAAPANILPDANPKTRFGVAKPPMHGVPASALLHLGLAMADGVRKYGLTNWRASPVSASVYYDAAFRHLLAWWDGENVARDSRRHHLAHVMACCAILLDAEATRNLNDDRPIPGVTADLIDQLTRKEVS